MHVALVSMPFASAYRPSIGLGLLQSGLRKQGIDCDTLYLNLKFAALIGLEEYDCFAENSTYPTNALAGEWIFSQSLFDGEDTFEEYKQYLITTYSRFKRKSSNEGRAFQRLLDVRAKVDSFLDNCLTEYDWSRYDVIGFTTVFEQNTASLSMAKLLKSRFPDKFIIFGGSNVESPMGLGTLRSFNFMDAVCSGEGDQSFISFIDRLRTTGDPAASAGPGIILRSALSGQDPGQTASSPPIHDMNALPYPNYDDYFSQFDNFGLQDHKTRRRFLFESSRGCWWGQKSHCLFCGLNGSTMSFRSKSPERALDEIVYLKERYGQYTNKATAVDNIIDMNYFKTVLPVIRDNELDLDMFYETKANLTKEQIRLFKEAGFHYVQPGIESMITSVLRLMKKGVSMLQNVRLLKWCSEYSVTPLWNFLYGFPGENEWEYDAAAELIPSLTHLMPPGGTAPIRLDRFSPYYMNPEAYGICNIRPLRSYELIYPALPPERLAQIAYHFDFDYADHQNPFSYTSRMLQAVQSWQAHYRESEFFSVLKDDRIILVDTRLVADQPTTLLTLHETMIYQSCDNMISVPNIVIRLREQGFTLHEDEVRHCLERFVERRWMVTEGEVYLALAVPLGTYTPKQAGLQRLRELSAASGSGENQLSALS
ncbi:RiPP maturation radical SAM C-methyltransferase [Paenibacillus sp. P96]|uniref:RiPP maturation radical SAM C-methyltransferase n=1 Tax=Paenibacillus zeirhizosphaerae TaxID=2987519 RepID=A0ABT9FMR9_9BACL|nr:RiPP maturation radical SAM C-methyltransferase [Paenibacillus sp. P96]MDP4096033.1 RiPP maturation radical SAM C-methyltransferase [Paenibacillus sp. P96]